MRRTAAGLMLVTVTVFVMLWLVARSKPQMSPWHAEHLTHEFNSWHENNVPDLAAYVAREDQLFDDLEAFVEEFAGHSGDGDIARYAPKGLANPCNFSTNWNRTMVLEPTGTPNGAVLLLHGLTDSPYSMRSTAMVLQEQGFHVVCLRLPGHGTIPGALTRARWQDWAAAVRIAARDVAAKAGDGPFVIVGYSNGGSLAVKYTLDAIEDEDLRVPDRLVLLSPAIGITSLARFAHWINAASRMPLLHPLAWESISREFDPYKYNSFPHHAATQSYQLTRLLNKQLARMEADDLLSAMPPVLTFASLVDATVLVEDMVSRLYARLPANGSELVIYDLNRAAGLESFYAKDPSKRMAALVAARQRNYALTVVRNTESRDAHVASHTVVPGTTSSSTPRDLEISWPRGVYSLSHVAIPFEPGDPLYGDGTTSTGHWASLPGFSPRGERGVLSVPASYFLRLRYNPFFTFQTGKIRDALRADGRQRE